VTAIEHDAELAAQARANLAPWAQAEVVEGDGRTHDPGEVDAIIVFAGSTHPAPLWLDRLAEGGRLVMPLTGEQGWGFMLRAKRQGSEFDAASISWVGIFPCVGGRDEDAARRLSLAMTKLPRASRSADMPIAALHRGDPSPEIMEKVWYHAPGFWLEHHPAAPQDIRVP